MELHISDEKWRASALSASLAVALATRLSAREPVESLVDDPPGREEQECRLDQRADAFKFRVAILMFFIGRLIPPSHGKKGDDRRAEVDEAVNRFRQDAERTGDQAGSKLGYHEHGACTYRYKCNRLLSGWGHRGGLLEGMRKCKPCRACMNG
jgi:hypothetical protein